MYRPQTDARAHTHTGSAASRLYEYRKVDGRLGARQLGVPCIQFILLIRIYLAAYVV